MLEVKIYGSGCSTCANLTKLVENIVKQNGLKAKVNYIGDFAEMAKLNILATPAISINGVIKSSGRIPSKKEIEEWLTN